MQPENAVFIVECDTDFAQDMAAFLQDRFRVELVDSSSGLSTVPEVFDSLEHTVFVVAVEAFPMFVEMLRCQAGGQSILPANTPESQHLSHVLRHTIVLGSDAASAQETLQRHFPTSRSSFSLALPVCTDRYPPPRALQQLIGRLRPPDHTSDAVHPERSPAVGSKKPATRSSAGRATVSHPPGMDRIP